MSPMLGGRAGGQGGAGAHWEVSAQGAGRVRVPREGGDPELPSVWLLDGITVTSLC